MREATRLNKRSGIWTIYTTAWKALWSQWKVILLIYSLNLLIAFIAMGPLSKVVTDRLAKTVYHNSLAEGFDYTLVMDILNNYGLGVDVTLTLLLSMAIPAFLWIVFCSGGITKICMLYPYKTSLSSFWAGGAEYFFRYLRLGLYVLAILGGILFLLLLLMADHLNALEMVSEGPAKSRFFLCVGLLLVAGFILNIFKELAKAKIAVHDKSLIAQPNSEAFLKTFTMRSIALGLCHFLVLGLVFGLYYLLRKLCCGYLIPLVLVGQLFLIYRIAHRFVKQASFCFLCASDREH